MIQLTQTSSSDDGHQDALSSPPQPQPQHYDNENDDIFDDEPPTTTTSSSPNDLLKETATPWSPSGTWWRDMLHFVGPGWFVSIAYVDPGNYQADIQAGATSRYSLLFVVWWTSLLSIYVQILCVRLAYYGNVTLAEAQARHFRSNQWRYWNWALAELSTVITDLPEVIGIGIACHVFFGWPYYVGVILSLLTTMAFLATLNCGMRVLEAIVFFFVAIMSVALFLEMEFVGVSTDEMLQGWWGGFQSVGTQDIFAMTGVVGAVVMPHNLYLHTAACQARPVAHARHVNQAVRWSSLEPVLPILVSFFVNLAIVAISAEKVYGTDGAAQVGLTDFCQSFSKLKGGCILWAIALLAAGQSSAITTTFTGQYVMDGFLQMELPLQWRAIVTRLVAITPCILVSVLFPHQLNRMVNIVNSSLSFLLPFAFTPLVKYNCSPQIMGRHNASRGVEMVILHSFAVAVWMINAVALSVQGGGFLGDLRAHVVEQQNDTTSAVNWNYYAILALEIPLQLFYAGWNWYVLRTPIQEASQEIPQSEDQADPYADNQLDVDVREDETPSHYENGNGNSLPNGRGMENGHSEPDPSAFSIDNDDDED